MNWNKAKVVQVEDIGIFVIESENGIHVKAFLTKKAAADYLEHQRKYEAQTGGI